MSLAADRWRPLVTQWLAAIENRGAVIPREFCEKLAKISDPCEMLGLERALWLQVGVKGKKQEFHRMALAITLELADNPYPAAAEALARGAVFSEYTDVRTTAAAGLKGRPLDHFAPLLLSGLQSQIEVGVAVKRGRFSWGILYSLYQQGALADLSLSYTLYFSPLIEFDDGTVVGAEDAISAAASRGMSANWVNSGVAAAAPGPEPAKVAKNFERASSEPTRRFVSVTSASSPSCVP